MLEAIARSDDLGGGRNWRAACPMIRAADSPWLVPPVADLPAHFPRAMDRRTLALASNLRWIFRPTFGRRVQYTGKVARNSVARNSVVRSSVVRSSASCGTAASLREVRFPLTLGTQNDHEKSRQETGR